MVTFYIREISKVFTYLDQTYEIQKQGSLYKHSFNKQKEVIKELNILVCFINQSLISLN